jgi:truncated hemoglobin YjbI
LHLPGAVDSRYEGCLAARQIHFTGPSMSDIRTALRSAPERNAWMLCMTRAQAEVVVGAPLRDTLAQAFFRTADFIRNDNATGPCP